MTNDIWININDEHAVNISDLRLMTLPSRRALRFFFRGVQDPFTLTFDTHENRNATHREIRKQLGFT